MRSLQRLHLANQSDLKPVLVVTQESTLEPSFGKIKRSSKYCHLNGFENNTFRQLNGRSNVVSIAKCQMFNGCLARY